MQRSWIDRPAVYRKVIFSVLAMLVALALLFASRAEGVLLEQFSVVQALYYVGAAIAFVLALLPWAWAERD